MPKHRISTPVLPALAVIFVSIILVHAAFYAFVPLSAWDLGWFGYDIRLSIISYEIALAALWAAIPTTLLMLASRRVPRLLRFVGSLSALWILFSFVLASWLFFVASGDFLGLEALAMWWRNFEQMWQHIVHIAPMALIWLTLGSLGLALLVLTGIWATAKFGEKAIRKAAMVFWIVAGVTFAFGSVWGSWRIEDDQQQKFRHVKHQRNGPFAYLTDSIADRLMPKEVAAVPSWADGFFERPERISMEQWLDNVDRDAVKRHNVILILIESLRRDALTSFGGNREAMPTLERLARDGKRYLNTFAQASHSNYADLVPLSSHYPLRSSVPYTYPKIYTYPRVLIYDILKPLGWRTGIFSSQNESWGGMANYLRTGNLDKFLHSETYEGPTYVPRYDKWFVAWMQGEKRSGKIDDRYTVAEAIDWIEQSDERPFFMYMNLQSSHLPYDVPADFEVPFELPEGVTSVEMRPGVMRILGSGEITQEQKVATVKTLYLNSLAYVDAQIGRLVESLKSRGILDETIIVVSADTGQAFYEHGYIGHGSIPYNEVVRVPMVIHGPGVVAGVDGGLAQHLDIPPTLLALLGIKEHPSFQGIDLRAASPDRRPPGFTVTQSPIAESLAVVWRNWKYIYDLETHKPMLFNIGADPLERRNLVGEAPAGLIPALGRLLGVWRRAQIDYYQNAARHSGEYPPRLPPGFDLRAFYRASQEAAGNPPESSAR